MNADVEKAVEYIADAVGHYPDIRDKWAVVTQALRDQEAEIARHVKVLADCFRMAGADPDGNEDWRIAPDALRAVTDLRRDYDEVLDWQDRAEKADALLRHVVAAHTGENVDGCDMRNADIDHITAHLGGEHD